MYMVKNIKIKKKAWKTSVINFGNVILGNILRILLFRRC